MSRTIQAIRPRTAIVSHIPALLLAGLIAVVAPAAATAEPFRDCPGCPPMVTLAPGAFTMGSTPEETTRERIDPSLIADERPAHQVTVATELAIGQFAVTRGEFAAFVAATGHASTGGCYVLSGDSWVFDRKRGWRDPGFAQTDQHPVVCVSHRDAQRYARWLARTTKKPYRLPSEAEWEYAARAGTATTRFWGDGRDEACAFANVSDFTGAEAMKWDKANKDKVFQCTDGYAFTSPGGAFRPNGFGLHDMLGNVWQWADDCYHTSYTGAPKDASAWRTGDCHFRVIRGGSWSFSPRSLRAARRCAIAPEERYYNLGFRVVRVAP